MASNRDDNILRRHEPTSPLELVAHLTDITIQGNLEEVDVGRSQFVAIYIDDMEGWKSKKRFSISPLHWQENCLISFRPSTSIKVQVFRKRMLSVIFSNKQHLIGQFSGRLVELLGNDEALDMTDDTGTRLDGIKIQIKLALISDSPRDLMGRVDAAIFRLDDSVFSQISNHVDMLAPMTKLESSSAQAISTCIPSLGQAFQAIVKIARTFGDAHPILRVSCTVLFCVYEAFKDEAILSATVRGLAESLREMAHAAYKCPDLLVIDGTENVIEAIGHVSTQIACLIDEYARLPSAVRSLRDALSDDMKTRVNLLQARCKDLRKKFNDRLNIDTRQTVHQIHKRQIAEQHERFLEWLKAPDPSRNYNSARARHQPGTGSWFFGGVEFSQWKERAGSMLWIYGIPGCGKTILCSSAVEEITMHCTSHPSSAEAYFLFDSRDAQDGLQRHEGLVRSLIEQLLLQCDGMPYGLEKLLSRGEAKPSEESLHAALELLLARFDHAYLLIDSLDECTERPSVLGWLQRILRWETFQYKIHILVTSRDELDIRQCLESLDAVQVCVQGKSVDDDIRSYIDHTLRTGHRIKKWNDATKAEIRESVLAVSGGMFRLAALQLEELRNCCNLRELRKRLARLPRSLYETYDRILSKVDEEYRLPALRILQWLAFSARPLRLNELTEVLAVDFETKPHPRLCDDLRYDSEDILIICSNLIVFSAEGNVQLAHLSVKEYMLTSTSLHNFGFATNEKLSHSLIAQTCLAYLLQFEAPEILNEGTLDNFPLAQYAAEHWLSHAQSGASDTGSLQALIHTFFTGNDIPFITWVRLNDLDYGTKRNMRRMPIGSRLYYACLAGLQDISLALLDSGEDPNAKGFDNVTVLQVASRSGQYQTVQRLLEKGAEVNKEGGFGPALKLASSKGYQDIVRLLLDNGADMNMQGREFDNTRALQEASRWGHEGVVRYLLEKGADVNLLGGASGSALQAASNRGHENIVRLLVDNGAKLDIRGGLYGTALHDTSEHGHIEIVRFLLEKGANVDMRGGQYNTALQAASQGGHEKIVRLLLENGADVGVQGGRYGSVLQAAASGGHRWRRQHGVGVREGPDVPHANGLPSLSEGIYANILRLLLEKGAQVNVPLGGEHGSALRAASSEGFKKIVQLLLEKGAKVNAESERHGTALQAAALKGHEEIVRLLVENGAEVNILEETHGSALQAAAYGGHKSIVELLLKEGARLNEESEEYGDALRAASLGGHEQIVRLLLETGAEVNRRSKRHGDALQAASKEGHEHVVRLLLDNGADIHIQGVGIYGSALRAASKREHQAIVDLLLEKGAVRLDDDAEDAH